MPYQIAIHDWSQYSTPAALSENDLLYDTASNDPNSPDYDPNGPTWIGETFSFQGGAPTSVYINDDDGKFEDGYVETGNAQVLDQPLTIGGVTYPAGSNIQNEFSMTDATGQAVYVVSINGKNVGFAYEEGRLPSYGSQFTATQGYDGDPYDSGDGTTSSTTNYNALACFTPRVEILTPKGARKVEDLTAEDWVLTRDAGAQPIKAILSRKVDFTIEPDMAPPIFIRAGSLAPHIPARDMIVSPQHCFVFDCLDRDSPREILAPAKALTALPGIRAMRGKRAVHYIHIVLPRHHVITAENTLTESCYLGPVTLASCTVAQKDELRKAFPLLPLFRSKNGYGQRARPVLSVQDAKKRLRSGNLAYSQSTATHVNT